MTRLVRKGITDTVTGLLISGEALVKSLTCNELELNAANHTALASVVEETTVSSPLCLEESDLVPLQAPVAPVSAPTHTPWLLTGLVLMGLNVYFLQLSPVSSLWSPL
ncbi:hypothetical protein DSO57_1021634 [Entomophthora muscae]|uniref:Uncharacterized protein n=1 Tax=Entomophthora muscae TaxID=34485 RepID=A0ACC2RUH0_9FUNG|nr:hypothetical protein DSO57_1021634 [Entomophthora muscae]